MLRGYPSDDSRGSVGGVDQPPSKKLRDTAAQPGTLDIPLRKMLCDRTCFGCCQAAMWHCFFVGHMIPCSSVSCILFFAEVGTSRRPHTRQGDEACTGLEEMQLTDVEEQGDAQGTALVACCTVEARIDVACGRAPHMASHAVM